MEFSCSLRKLEELDENDPPLDDEHLENENKFIVQLFYTVKNSKHMDLIF